MLGKLVSLLGSNIQSFALSLYVLKITGSAAQFAGILSIVILPDIILGPFAGVLVDWFDRKKIIVALDMFNGILIGIYAMIFLVNGKLSVLSIYALVVILSIVSLFFQPAITTVIPSIMKKDEIADANAVNSLILSLGQLAAPIISGALFGIFGLSMILIINSISFIISSISEMFIIIPKINKRHQHVNIKSFKNDFDEGINFIKTKPIISAILSIGMISNFAFAPLSSIGIAFVAKQILKVSDYKYGMIDSATCLAMLMGPILFPFIKNKLSIGRIAFQSTLIVGIFTGILALVPTNFYRGLFITSNVPYFTLLIVLFIIAVVISVNGISINTLMQTEVPVELMGRVNTVSIAFGEAAMPLGQMLFGFLFDNIPACICYLITASVFLLSALIFKNKLVYTTKIDRTINA